jgi:type II secretory pathway pseudopilin PulG
MTGIARNRSQNGFALLGVLGVMMVLGILGVVVYRNVNTDIRHTGNEIARVRAEFAAESAVQWGLAEVARKRPGIEPFTLGTHGPEGEEPLGEGGELVEGMDNGGDAKRVKLKAGDVERMEGARGGVDQDGWIYSSVNNRQLSVSNAKSETLAFKVWYPNDSTLRIQGRGEADGNVADVDLVSTIRILAIPMP